MYCSRILLANCSKSCKSGCLIRLSFVTGATTPDQKAVKLSLKLSQVMRGPGLWKFKNSLLKDKNYLTLITESYPIISEKYANIVDKRLRWELIKMEIRSITISFASRKAKEFRKQESDLQKRLDEIDKSISNSCDNQNIEDKLKVFDKLKMNLIAFTKSREKEQYFVPKRDGLKMAKSQPNTSLIWRKKVIPKLLY